MQYVEAKATATSTDQELGLFEAIVATWDRDRQGDRIVRGAFGKSIDEWVEVGRAVPLHWHHRSDEIIGEVDPTSMAELADGLEVSGRIDLDDELGRKAWKGLKQNRLAFSFGFLATKTREADDGARELMEIDIFEVSVTPSPANNRTRLLSTKSFDLPPELIGTALDPAFSGEIPTKAQIDAEMKAIRAARPIQIATFEC